MVAASPALAQAPTVLAAAGEARTVADVDRVIDGDTLAVTAEVWPGVVVRARVRLLGVDAPELRGACPAERAAAAAARDLVAALAGARVTLTGIRRDKYAGRVDARVALADGRDLGAVLIAAGLGRPYDGGRRGGWCD